VDGRDLLLVTIAVMIIGGTGFVIGRANGGTTVNGMKLFLWSWMLGMLGYILYGIGALESTRVGERFGEWTPLLVGALSGILPLAIHTASERLVKRPHESEQVHY
jgi:hypothetical protein